MQRSWKDWYVVKYAHALNLFRVPVAKWLSHEVLELLSSGGLTVLFNSQVQGTVSHHLNPFQEQLVGVVCRLPDCLANRLGRQLSRHLLPQQYFERVGNATVECLKEMCSLHTGELDSKEQSCYLFCCELVLLSCMIVSVIICSLQVRRRYPPSSYQL